MTFYGIEEKEVKRLDVMSDIENQVPIFQILDITFAWSDAINLDYKCRFDGFSHGVIMHSPYPDEAIDEIRFLRNVLEHI